MDKDPVQKSHFFLLNLTKSAQSGKRSEEVTREKRDKSHLKVEILEAQRKRVSVAAIQLAEKREARSKERVFRCTFSGITITKTLSSTAPICFHLGQASH